MMTTQNTELIGTILRHVSKGLEVIMGRGIRIATPATENGAAKPTGKGTVHVSFNLSLSKDGEPEKRGALLVPLADAITIACFMLMIPESAITSRRGEKTLDPMIKDALLEIANMLGASCTAALTEVGGPGWVVRSAGCQGVRSEAGATLPDGFEFVAGRAAAQVEPFPPYELILIVPGLD